MNNLSLSFGEQRQEIYSNLFVILSMIGFVGSIGLFIFAPLTLLDVVLGILLISTLDDNFLFALAIPFIMGGLIFGAAATAAIIAVDLTVTAALMVITYPVVQTVNAVMKLWDYFFQARPNPSSQPKPPTGTFEKLVANGFEKQSKKDDVSSVNQNEVISSKSVETMVDKCDVDLNSTSRADMDYQSNEESYSPSLSYPT